MSFTGMTFEEVDDQLTLQRYNALQRFWTKHPPTAILIAHYVGYKAPAESSAAPEAGDDEEMDDESMAALASIFGLPQRQRKAGE